MLSSLSVSSLTKDTGAPFAEVLGHPTFTKRDDLLRPLKGVAELVLL